MNKEMTKEKDIKSFETMHDHNITDEEFSEDDKKLIDDIFEEMINNESHHDHKYDREKGIIIV